jgi:hypothetical protein
MRDTTDLWYLRFPDGRVLRAAGTAVVRQQMVSGRIPAGTQVRRSLNDDWAPAERYPELADATGPRFANGLGGRDRAARETAGQAPATIASRLDPLQLDQVGVRGLLEELLAALDSTAVGRKLFVAVAAGVVFGILGGLALMPFFSFALVPPGPGFLLVLGVLVVEAAMTSVLAQLTFTEVSRLRPARWREGLKNLTGFTWRFGLLHALMLAVGGGLILAVRWLPGYLLESAGEGSSGWLIGARAAAVCSVFLEALLWPLVLLLLPLGPLLAIEECSAFRGLLRWSALVRRHFVRLLLAEGLALGIALLLNLPLALLLLLLRTRVVVPELELPTRIAEVVVVGVGCSLLLGYLVVANVFIYLHLRYESAAQR